MLLLRKAGVALALAFWTPVGAHDVITTKVAYSREIIRIFQRRCFSCHQEGGKAPMALTSYEVARPWAKAIKEEVLERRMPPWGAVKGFGFFQHDMGLSQEEVGIIADWVEGGAPEGDAKYYPAAAVLAETPPAPLQGVRMMVNGTLRTARPVRLVGIEPRATKDVTSVRVIAEQPDGAVEPLLWLRNYKQGWKRQFTFRQPVALAAGTTIRVEPANQAAFVVYAQR